MTVVEDTFGSGGRVGYVAPSTCERAAREFYEVAPSDLGLVIASLPISQLSPDHVDAALGRIHQAAVQTVETGAEVVFSAGLPLVVDRGPGFDRTLREGLEESTGRPCGTDLGVTLAAIAELDLDDILMVTPFTRGLNDGIVRLLEQAGLRVLGDTAMGYDRQDQYGFLPSSAPLHAARELLARHPAARGIYIPCGRIGAVLELDAWEAELGVPVLTANQMMIWWALRQFDAAPSRSCGALLGRRTHGLDRPPAPVRRRTRPPRAHEVHALEEEK